MCMCTRTSGNPDSTDFFPEPGQRICLLYQTNEMGSLLEGNVYLRLSPQDISALNAKNPRK